jgi:hypothetical protein
MFRKTFALLAAVAACGLALAAGPASADPGLVQVTPIKVAPVDVRLRPIRLTPDLYVSGATSSSVKITNSGLLATGAFTIKFSSGWIGDACGWTVPGSHVRVSGMGGFETRTIAVPSASSTNRTVTLDIYNEVSERSELNNTGTVPGSVIIC